MNSNVEFTFFKPLSREEINFPLCLPTHNQKGQKNGESRYPNVCEIPPKTEEETDRTSVFCHSYYFVPDVFRMGLEK